MDKIGIACLFLLGAGAVAPAAPAQLQQNSTSPPAVLRAPTRLVHVDVVVTDSSGHPPGNPLTAENFTILEDGEPQKVTFFSFHPMEEEEKRQPPQLPPHVVTNRPEYQRNSGPPVILLLDGLNTPADNQMVVRLQMLKFLADNFDPHTRMAVYVLGNELSVLQDFTSDPAVLAAALRKYRSQNAAEGRPNGTDTQMQAPKFEGVNLPPQAAGQFQAGGGGTGEAGSRSAFNLSFILARFEKEAAASAMEMRVERTTEALSLIARRLAGFPGRKIVIWFSASFPLNLSMVDPEDIDVFRSYADRVRQATNLLSDAQVAIYTVDARGLVGSAIADPSESGRDAGGRMNLTVGQHMNANSKEAFERFNRQDSLVKVAQETGGRSFLNTNDFGRAISEGVRDGSTFYALGYYPSRKRWDGKFHTIKVKLARDGLSARHRRGYYALDPGDWRKAGGAEMKTALANDAVSSTGVLFYARALPSSASAEVKIEFLVDAHTITFETGAENQRFCSLEFQVQAFTPEGKLVKAEVQQAEAPLKPQTFSRIQQSGLPMPVPLKLEPGDYVLRLGVRDNRTGLFGTAELPLTVAPAP